MGKYYLFLVFFLFTLFIPKIQCETDPVAYSRYSTCRTQRKTDDARIKEFVPLITPMMAIDKPKGYLGTVGIVGGSVMQTGSAYFAAMAALRVGADSVHIFCTRLAAPALQSFSPDIIVHPLFDVNVDIMIQKLNTMDIIIMGPGMDKEAHGLNTVVPRVIQAGKAAKKPMILDLDVYFLTQNTLNNLVKYPSPGVVMIMNTVEFEFFYPLIKRTGLFSDSQVHIDFDKMGEFFMIYRKGCTDMAITMNPLSTWSLSEGETKRRTSGQGDIIAGATAVYFNWALKTIPLNVTAYHGAMLPGSVAAYTAAKLMRDANAAAFADKGRSSLTSDMLAKIPDIINGRTSTSNE